MAASEPIREAVARYSGSAKVQGETLDFDYLNAWAIRLRVASDLSQAIEEAGL